MRGRQALAKKWADKRTMNCMPSFGKRVYEKVDLQSYRNEETFAEVFQDGDVMSLDDYLESQNISPQQFATSSKKVRFLEEAGGCTGRGMYVHTVCILYTSRGIAIYVASRKLAAALDRN